LLPQLLAALTAVLISSNNLQLPAAESPDRPLQQPVANPAISFQHEIQRAIDRGLSWLQSNQTSNGWWSTPDHPAVTALALAALKGDPRGRYQASEPAWLRNGYKFLLSCVQPDGGIHRTNLVTYNTSLSMLALLAADRAEYDSTVRRARKFLVGLQQDFGVKGVRDNAFDGGIGYGSKYEHSDMGNTLAALEALYHSRRVLRDQAPADVPELDWEAAIHFLQNCQNLPEYNKQPWASDDPKHKGGFVYYPGLSKAGSETNRATGRVALRSYGSISYSGLLSYIYAKLERDDPRVVAVVAWLARNYTLKENPGMGPQGFYYYLHTATKALTAHGAETLQLENGHAINWRRDIAMRLINLQQRDGSWSNENGRWWEKDPALVTSYAVLSLELIWHGL
jgi:squalene-hopene/tetraprenyl-beta-curcumene cyclase